MTRSLTHTGRTIFLALAMALLPATHALAQGNPFAGGWSLNAEASNIKFQSVKNQTKVESSSIATFTGGIDESGKTNITVLMDSVDTKIDLRNVRMRFLFFETFKYPEATISATITPDMIAGLQDVRRKTVMLPFDFTLHGITKQLEAEVAVTLLTDDLVSVASATPLSISVADFDLSENVKKLEEAAGGISIVPSATVSFDFLFARNPTGAQTTVAAAPAEQKPASAALETAGDFSVEACKGRFEILSRTGNIYFRTASARLDGESVPLLTSIIDIANRCPGLTLEVSGHTDSDGSDATNQSLSEARAQAVSRYLADNGIDAGRIRSVGYGETRPVLPNTSRYNKSRNRRIEFTVLDN